MTVHPDRRLNFSRRADRALRVKVFKRNDYTCQGCGWRPHADAIPAGYDGRYTIGFWPNPHAERTLHVDHVRPFSRGGRTTIRNLQTMCDRCNVRKWAKV